MKKLLLSLAPLLFLGCIASESEETVAGDQPNSSSSVVVVSESSSSATSISSALPTSSSDPVIGNLLVGSWAGPLEDEGVVFGVQRFMFASTTFELEIDFDMGTGSVLIMELSGAYVLSGNEIQMIPTTCMMADMEAVLTIMFGGGEIEGPVPLTVDCMQPSEDEFSSDMSETMNATYQIDGNILTIVPEPDPQYPDEDDTMILQRQ